MKHEVLGDVPPGGVAVDRRDRSNQGIEQAEEIVAVALQGLPLWPGSLKVCLSEDEGELEEALVAGSELLHRRVEIARASAERDQPGADHRQSGVELHEDRRGVLHFSFCAI